MERQRDTIRRLLDLVEFLKRQGPSHIGEVTRAGHMTVFMPPAQAPVLSGRQSQLATHAVSSTIGAGPVSLSCVAPAFFVSQRFTTWKPMEQESRKVGHDCLV